MGMGGVAGKWQPRVKLEPMLGEEEICKEEQSSVGRSSMMRMSAHCGNPMESQCPRLEEQGVRIRGSQVRLIF